MPPPSQTPLSEAQLAALDAWLAAGAMAPADAHCPDDTPSIPDEPTFSWPDDCEERYELRAHGAEGAPFRISANSEIYPVFEFPVPWGGRGPVQALAMRPLTDNARVVHHWILYQGMSYLTGWSPGKGPEVPPEDVGIYMPNSGTLRLELHYYNMGNNNDELDRSGVEICITRTPRANTATTYPFAAPATVPANRTVTNENTCTIEADGPVFLTTSSPHMHKLGVRAKLEILRSNGSIDVVHDSLFSFEDQVTVPVDFVLQAGDRVRTTCVYNNTTNRTVRFGTSSEDEMCFNFARYYPMCGMRCTGGDAFSAYLTASQGGGCPSQ